jgi:uncharacterized damage-inducible protein DinB
VVRMEFMVRLEQLLDSWKTVRADAAQAVLDMPEGDLDFRPVEDLMSFREIARHILNAGHALAGMMLDGVDNLSAPGAREKMASYAPALPSDPSAADLAEAMNRVVETDCSALASRPADFFTGMITRFDGQQVTRLELLAFTKEHELTHRSQLFTYLRLKGVVPPTTRRKMMKK